MSVSVSTEVKGKAVAAAIPTGKLSNDEKLEAGWRYVTIPDRDIYDYVFKGMWINQDHYKPGKHLVPPDVADSLEERLVAWEDYSKRLSRPSAHLQSLQQLQPKE